jgi:hypothetical protein
MRLFIPRFLAVAAAAAVAIAGPAEAQGGDSATMTSRITMADFGVCVARTGRHAAETFLATFPFSASAAKAARRLVTNDCLVEDEMVNSEAARGPLYEALYRLDFGKRPAADLSKAPKLDYGPRGDQPIDQPADVLTNLRRFADCTVRQDPGPARNLVLSKLGSAEETLAFLQLGPAMNGCIVPGHTLSLKRPMLRSVIAETLYRLSAAAAGRPAPVDRN